MNGEGIQTLTVDVLRRQWLVHRPADLESLWDSLGREDFGPDERIPYWVELWPSSLALAEWLDMRRELLCGAVCLDVGCGLGLNACVASSLGARVVGMDYMAEALIFASMNARANAAGQLLWVRTDWRFPAFRPHCFDLIWGADIFYEKRFAKPLAALFHELLAPSGRIWIAEPERSVSTEARELIKASGFSLRLALEKTVSADGPLVNITIWEAEKKE